MKKKRSLGTTVHISMISLVVITLVVVSATMIFRLYVIKDTLIANSGKLGERAGEISSTSMAAEVDARLNRIVNDQADIVDSNFGHFRSSVELLANEAVFLYENADEFGRFPVEEPKAENDGKLVVHVSHSEKTDMEDPAVIDELGLLGNESNTLIYTHAGNPAMAKCYLATESGLMIEADRNSSDKLDENGNLKFYEASKRPWYIGTKETMATYFTNVTPEASGKRIGMMCGSPIIANGKFMGVACAGMYLDDLDEMVQSTKIGDDGISCIVNNQGQLLFSSGNVPELMITKENAERDLRQSDNKDLASMIEDAMAGIESSRIIELDGESYCAAFASMETVGWSFIIMIPQKVVLESTNALLDEITDMTEQTEIATNTALGRLLFGILIIGIAAVVIASITAFYMARSIAAPLRDLTAKVRKIQGEDLDFDWNETGDEEILTLAESFKNMTERMKQYIDEVTRVTAEKERIGAELSVATQIQADMLPRIFPPFPERHEFELFASMDPAKEVGGDFYDFFLVDDDHLGLVVADVSGKGVPAALFMVIAKTLIKNRAMLNGSPSQVLQYANEQLCEGNEAELFVTVWLAIIEISTGKGLAANAGHEHPAIKRAGGKWELEVYRHSPAVATIDGLKFPEHEFELHPGDSLFVYTDGVPEATNNKDEMFGTDRMLDSLNSKPDADITELLKIVKKDVDEFTGDAPQFDDVTMLGLTWNGGNK